MTFRCAAQYLVRAWGSGRRPGGAALGSGCRGAGEAELLLGEVRRGEPRGGAKDGGGDESGRRRARDGIGEGAAVVAAGSDRGDIRRRSW